MKKVKITEIPPGFAPEHIREQWLGIELQTQNEKDDGSGLRTGMENAGGYKVKPEDALTALKDAGKDEAYDFWKPRLAGTSNLVFKTECCEEV